MSRPFTNSFARSLYSTPKSAPTTTASGTSTSGDEPTSSTSQYPSPLPNTAVGIDQTPTGRWAHPAMSKITQSQSRNAPNDTTIRRVLLNFAALLILSRCSPYIQKSTYLVSHQSGKYVQWVMVALYSLLVYNIVENARRFWWKGTFEDPTLTDTQRKLLNLPASPVSAKRPDNAPTVTPPRYQKAFTPSPSSQSSPLSGSAGRRSSYGSYSPSGHPTGHVPSSLALNRNSPLQTRSPNPTRSVSMLSSQSPADSVTRSGVALETQLDVGTQGKAGKSTADFAGSTRWKYARGNGLDASSRTFY